MNEDYFVENVKYKNYEIKIYYESTPESPREWDNLGTMLCLHSKYNLGDKHEDIGEIYGLNYLTKKENIKELKLLESIGFLSHEDINEAEERDEFEIEKRTILNLIRNHPDYITLPLYLYDHSGITIRTYPFSCRWDSGMVGIIFVSKKEAKKEFPEIKEEKELREKIEQILINEVNTYDQYIRGEIYGYNVEKEGIHIDSCWGYYSKEHLLSDAEGMADWDIETEQEALNVLNIPTLRECKCFLD